MKTTLLSFLSLSALSAAMVASCVDGTPLEGRSCPCAAGWTCCAGEQTCVKDGSRCPSSGQPAPDGGHPPGDARGLPPEPAYTVPAAFAGTWTGYQENLEIGGRSDVVKIVVGTNADGSAAVSVVLGTQAPPPPATDPDAFWPPGSEPFGGLTPLQVSPIIEGFVYQARMVRVDGPRLRFDIATAEPWQPWCALQTSYPFPGSPGHYQPLPGSSGGSYPGDAGQICYVNDPNGGKTEVSCAATFDGYKCECEADGCNASVSAGGASFDLNFSGDTVNGTTSAYGNHNVRLTRAQ